MDPTLCIRAKHETNALHATLRFAHFLCQKEGRGTCPQQFQIHEVPRSTLVKPRSQLDALQLLVPLYLYLKQPQVLSQTCAEEMQLCFCH